MQRMTAQHLTSPGGCQGNNQALREMGCWVVGELVVGGLEIHWQLWLQVESTKRQPLAADLRFKHPLIAQPSQPERLMRRDLRLRAAKVENPGQRLSAKTRVCQPLAAVCCHLQQ